MSAIHTIEAEGELARWLDRAAGGEAVILTRHGAPVARLVPLETAPGSGAARAAARRIRERAEQLRLGRFDWPEWRALRDEGRP